MGIETDTISCPKCGALCETRKIGFLEYILYCIVVIFFGAITFGIGIIVGLIVYLILRNNARKKPVECKKCGFRFIP